MIKFTLVPIAVVILAMGAFGFDSLNVSLVGKALGGQCIAVDTDGDYAYIGAGGKFSVIDISDPANPAIIGEILKKNKSYNQIGRS